MGNHSCRCRLRYLVAGTLLENADASLALRAFRSFLFVRCAALLDGNAGARTPVASGRRSHCRPSTCNSRAVSRRSSSYLHIHALHFVWHGVSYSALVVVCSVHFIIHCGDGDSSPYRRTIARVTFRRTVHRIQAARSGVHSLSQVERFPPIPFIRGLPSNRVAASTNSFNPFFSRSSNVRNFTCRRFFPVPSSRLSRSSSEVP